MGGRWIPAAVLVGVFTAPCAEAARVVVAPSRTELLYSGSSADPSCSLLSKVADPALPLNVVRLSATPPSGAPAEQVRYQWSLSKPQVGKLAADLDLGPDEQEPAIRTLCAELGNGCVLTEEQLAVYNHPSILWVAPGCDILPDDTTRPFRGGRVRIGVRVSVGKRRMGKGTVSVGFGRLGSLTLLVRDPGGRRFRSGIGDAGGVPIFINPQFAMQFDPDGAELPALTEIKLDSGGGGSTTVTPPCFLDPAFVACTQVGDILYNVGGKQVASATALLTDGSALCDKMTVNVRTTTIVPKLDISLAPKRGQYVPGDPASGFVNLRVRLRNASPPGSGGNILLVGNVLMCDTEARVGPSTITKTCQVDLQHCSTTANEPCQSNADCQPGACETCQPGEICLTSSHCSTRTATPIGCTSDADCRPPRCPPSICSPADTCIEVLPLSQVFLGVGDAVDLIESTVPVVNTLTTPARVTDTWTVHTFNAGDDSDVVKYRIAPRPGVKP